MQQQGSLHVLLRHSGTEQLANKSTGGRTGSACLHGGVGRAALPALHRARSLLLSVHGVGALIWEDLPAFRKQKKKFFKYEVQNANSEEKMPVQYASNM